MSFVVTIPLNAYQSLRDVELRACAISNPGELWKSSLTSLTLISANNFWPSPDLMPSLLSFPMLSKLETFCLVRGSLPALAALENLGNLKVTMPNLKHLHLGGNLDHIASVFDVLSIPAPAIIILKCNFFEPSINSRIGLFETLARHYTSARAAGDFFANMEISARDSEWHFSCSYPCARATILHPSTLLSIDIVIHATTSFISDDLSVPPAIFSSLLWDACRLLPLDGDYQVLRLASHYSLDNWMQSLSLLHGVRKLVLNDYFAAWQAFERPSGAQEPEIVSRITSLFPLLDELRLRWGGWGSYTQRQCNTDDASNDRFRSAQRMLRLLQSELEARGRDITVYINDEMIDVTNEIEGCR